MARESFAVELDGEPVPVEVKAAENLQSKSLKVARDRFELKRCVCTSLSGYREESRLTNLPLWAITALGPAA